MTAAAYPHSERRLQAGLVRLGLEPALAEPLMAYLVELEKWNGAYNLSGIKFVDEMVIRHVFDSLAVLQALPPLAAGSRMIDVGSGAGVPGLVLAIALPQLQVTTLDSAGKKARFMRHAIRTLKLPNADVFEGRAEDCAPAQPYDFVISRAFASLPEYLSVTKHLAGPGGKWLAMKGKLDTTEPNNDLAQLPSGFEICDVKALHVPDLDEARHLVIATRP